jgi:hypothetical protein
VNTNTSTICMGIAMLGCALSLTRMQNASAGDAPDGAGAAGLSQPEVSACSEEIRRARARWKYWPGEASDAAARLGRIQKELFEGRCAAHPQARAYVTGANRMLEHARAAGSAGSSSGDSQREGRRPYQDARNMR